MDREGDRDSLIMFSPSSKSLITYRFVTHYNDGSPCIMYRDSVQDLSAQKRYGERKFGHNTFEVTISKAHILFNEIKNDPAALQWLKDKAKWEHMTLFQVLECWGDPRKWF